MSSPSSTPSYEPGTFTALNKRMKEDPDDAASSPTSSTSHALSKDPEEPTSSVKKAKKEPQKPSNPTPKKVKKDTKDVQTPTTKKVKIETTPNKLKNTTSIPLPRSPADASEADKMLVREKDAGTPWGTIRTKWHQLTGQTVGSSTLPNRYARIKAYMVTFTPEQDALLLASKSKVEKEFEASKWGTIGDALSGGDGGGVKFTSAMVQRRFKELTKLMKDGDGDGGVAGAGKGDGGSDDEMEE